MKNKDKNPESRRDFIKKVGAGAAAVVVSSQLMANESSDIKKQRLAMVIDLQKCTGCGGCTLACKNENNVPDGILWADKISQTKGKFPNVRYDYLPTLCNHCEKAPCVKACPTKAMHKIDNGITMHNHEKCIGCRYCMVSCPYKVISFNDQKPHKRWHNDKALINGVTASPKELSDNVGGDVIPYYNEDRAKTYAGIRPKHVVEKCTFCDHRVKDGKEPYCVKRCPANARIFGDLDDPNSEVNILLSKYNPYRLREDLGTEPKVFYIRDFNPASY